MKKDIDKIKELLEAFDASTATTLKWKQEGEEILLKKETEKVVAQPNPPQSKEIDNKTQVSKGHEVTSPIVGTFYESAGPDSEPFVAVGSKVKKGDVVCIVEAMKLMNEIQADRDGEVIEILIRNEEMVEYGQPLMIIR